MSKVAFLLKRRAGVPLAAFHDYLRDHFGPGLSAQPDVRGCVQSLTLAQGYRKGELLFDGLYELWFDGAEGFERFRDHFAAQQATGQAAEYLDAAQTVIMPVDVHVMKDGRPATDGVKSIEFVNRRDDVPLDEFRRYWREHHGPLACHIEEFGRYEQNHLRDEAYGSGPPAFDGLAITWFDSTEDMKKTVRTPAYEATREDEAAFLRPGHLPFIITTEDLLKR